MSNQSDERQLLIRQVVAAKFEQCARDINEQIPTFFNEIMPDIYTYVYRQTEAMAYVGIIMKLIAKYEKLGISKEKSTQYFQRFVKYQVKHDIQLYQQRLASYMDTCNDTEDIRITKQLFTPSVVLSRGGRLLISLI